MIPDLPHYLPLHSGSHALHSTRGALLIGVPLALALCAFSFWVRVPARAILNLPPNDSASFKAVLRDARNVRVALKLVAILVVSIVIGEATHILWDSFTHQHGWIVEHAAFLRSPLWWPDSNVFRLLHHLSDLIGLSILIALWRRWQRRRESVASADRWIWFSRAAIVAIPVAVAATTASRVAFGGLNWINWEVVLIPVITRFVATLITTFALVVAGLRLRGYRSRNSP